MAANSSRWEKLEALSVEYDEINGELESIYRPNRFSMDVRKACDRMIEDAQWNGVVDTKTTKFKGFAKQLLDKLLKDVKSKIRETKDTCVKAHLRSGLQSLKEMYEMNPLRLVEVMQECIYQEKCLLEKYTTGNCSDAGLGPVCQKEDPNIIQKLEELKRLCLELQQCQENLTEAEGKYLTLKAKQESIQPSNQMVNGERQHNMEERIKKILKDKEDLANNILAARKDAIGREYLLLQALDSTLALVLVELNQWKLAQQRSVTGEPRPGSLDNIQTYFSQLAEYSSQLITYIDESYDHSFKDPCVGEISGTNSLLSMRENTIKLLRTLVERSFVIEHQPHQIIKLTKGKTPIFDVTIRLLVGSTLGIHSVDVGTEILTPESSSTATSKDHGAKINNGKAKMTAKSGSMTATFSNMQLTDIKKHDRREREDVTDQKYGIIFKAAVNLQKGIDKIELKALSAPIVVITHSLQESNAWATILWDSAFASEDRTNYRVPDSAPWKDVGTLLSNRFSQATGQGLSKEDLHYLACKAFDDSNKDVGSHDERMLSRNRFYKDLLGKQKFTFWKWFSAVLNLTKECFKEPWKQGYIAGFMSKKTAIEKLGESEDGTCLLRFSESEVEDSQSANFQGGLSILLVIINKDIRTVIPIKPLPAKQIKENGFWDTLRDITLKVGKGKSCVSRKVTIIYTRTAEHKHIQDIPKTTTRKECCDDYPPYLVKLRCKLEGEVFLSNEDDEDSEESVLEDGHFAMPPPTPESMTSSPGHLMTSPSYNSDATLSPPANMLQDTLGNADFGDADFGDADFGDADFGHLLGDFNQSNNNQSAAAVIVESVDCPNSWGQELASLSIGEDVIMQDLTNVNLNVIADQNIPTTIEGAVANDGENARLPSFSTTFLNSPQFM